MGNRLISVLGITPPPWGSWGADLLEIRVCRRGVRRKGLRPGLLAGRENRDQNERETHQHRVADDPVRARADALDGGPGRTRRAHDRQPVGVAADHDGATRRRLGSELGLERRARLEDDRPALAGRERELMAALGLQPRIDLALTLDGLDVLVARGPGLGGTARGA